MRWLRQLRMAEETQNNSQETEVTETTPKIEATAAFLAPGMIVRVHQKIKETTPKGDERERVQIFEGTIIAKKGRDEQSSTITVRKIASGVGVERIFPIQLPTIAKIEIVKQLDTTKSKLYYLREYKKKIKERPAKGLAATPKKAKA